MEINFYEGVEGVENIGYEINNGFVSPIEGANILEKISDELAKMPLIKVTVTVEDGNIFMNGYSFVRLPLSDGEYSAIEFLYKMSNLLKSCKEKETQKSIGSAILHLVDAIKANA